jgi:putative transposase
MVSMELETPDIDPMTIARVSGVDVGRRYLAVETDLQNKSKFYSGKEARHKANRYQKARKTLQCKSTPSPFGYSQVNRDIWKGKTVYR